MAEKLKNMFFTDSFLEQLAKEIGHIYPAFNKKRFLILIRNPAWKDMELKRRMRHISECLHQTLPEFPQALDILKKAAPKFRGFDAMVFPDFVEAYGLEHRAISLQALWLFTKQCSSEFAIRPFLKQDLPDTIKLMMEWASDPDAMVRRLASEGCRPRLPWAMALPELKKDPRPILPILEKLKDDESEMVRRSVANNLNDISKDHPDTVLKICRRWYGSSEETDKLIKHACRDMLKLGNTGALILFGFADPEHVSIDNLKISKKSITIGEDIRFYFDVLVEDLHETKLRLEYRVHYVKANGKHSPKIFQIREGLFAPGRHSLSKKHSFQDFSTRTHYPGSHIISVIVNGQNKAEINLALRSSET